MGLASLGRRDFMGGGAAGAPPAAWAPPWLVWALDELGHKEIPGPRENPRIRYYHSFTNGGPASEEVPWCSSGLCAAFEVAGIPSTRSKAAASWEAWGEVSRLRLGAVMFFGKSDPDAKGTGHVALCGGWSDDRVLAVGANQSNAWSAVPRSRVGLLAVRWPKGYVWP